MDTKSSCSGKLAEYDWKVVPVRLMESSWCPTDQGKMFSSSWKPNEMVTKPLLELSLGPWSPTGLISKASGAFLYLETLGKPELLSLRWLFCFSLDKSSLQSLNSKRLLHKFKSNVKGQTYLKNHFLLKIKFFPFPPNICFATAENNVPPRSGGKARR